MVVVQGREVCIAGSLLSDSEKVAPSLGAFLSPSRTYKTCSAHMA